jgi:tungstate transport system substrate-binding protein
MGRKILILAALVAVLLVFSAGCTTPPQPNATPNATSPTPTGTGGAGTILHVSTTTSLEATGLLAALERIYEPTHNVDLQFLAQGTGQSLDTARRCDADMVLVHSPSLEQTFINEGYGINARCFAYNYYIIVGPSSDPAKITDRDPVAAFQAIYQAGANNTPGVTFVSRGDNSGTHNAEKTLWQRAGYNYTTQVQGQPWYVEIGQGMGETLQQASERGGYTLSDEGTYLSYQSQLQLETLVGQGPALLNRYSAMAVNPAKCPETKIRESNDLINWLISDEGQSFIGNYGVAEYGQPLFIPLNGTLCGEPQFNCTCEGQVS